MTAEIIATAQSWIDAEDDWRETVAELFALGRALGGAEHDDLVLASHRMDVARNNHTAALRDWARSA